MTTKFSSETIQHRGQGSGKFLNTTLYYIAEQALWKACWNDRSKTAASLITERQEKTNIRGLLIS